MPVQRHLAQRQPEKAEPRSCAEQGPIQKCLRGLWHKASDPLVHSASYSRGGRTQAAGLAGHAPLLPSAATAVVTSSSAEHVRFPISPPALERIH